jgi:surface antigen
MMRALVTAGLLAVAPLALSHTSIASAQGAQQCSETPAKKARKSMFGSLLGGIANSALGRAGVPGSVAGVSLPVGSMLTDAIINLLDCKEQQQAAQATDKAVRGGVGTEVSWQSETRPNVSGKSTVTGEEKLADGGQCMTVNDVVIVDGEETTVPKKMCRAAGASGYVKV